MVEGPGSDEHLSLPQTGAGTPDPLDVDPSGGSTSVAPTFNQSGIVSSYMVAKSVFDRVTGLDVNEKILRLSPQGNRITVMLNPPPETYKGLVLPEQWSRSEKSGSGWVIAVGPQVGCEGGIPYPGGPVLKHSWDLLYKQILFGEYIGKIIRVEFLDRSTKSPYVQMTDRDIWAIDWNPSEFLEKDGVDAGTARNESV